MSIDPRRIGLDIRVCRGSCVGVIFLGVMLPMSGLAFTADGLHSGMTLEDVKDSPAYRDHDIIPLASDKGFEIFKADHYKFLYFCHGRLAKYRKTINNPGSFMTILRLMYKKDITYEKFNQERSYLHDKQLYYEQIYKWNEGHEEYQISFLAVAPLAVAPIDISGMSNFSLHRDIVVFKRDVPQYIVGIEKHCG